MRDMKLARKNFIVNKVKINSNMLHMRVKNRIGTQVGGIDIIMIDSWRMFERHIKLKKK